MISHDVALTTPHQLCDVIYEQSQSSCVSTVGIQHSNTVEIWYQSSLILECSKVIRWANGPVFDFKWHLKTELFENREPKNVHHWTVICIPTVVWYPISRSIYTSYRAHYFTIPFSINLFEKFSHISLFSDHVHL